MVVISKTVNRDVALNTEPLKGVTFNRENKGHKFVISCMRGGALETVTGTVVGYFMRANNTTCRIAGEGFAGVDSDGRAWVVLPQDCYNVAGRFKLSVYVSHDGASECIYSCIGTVERSDVGEVIDSGVPLPSYDDIEDMYQEMESAVESAQQAASFVPTIIASTYSTSLTYHVGDYCTYEGALYRCIAETDGAFNPAHWEAVKVGSEFQNVDAEIDDLKSAIDSIAYYGINLFDKTQAKLNKQMASNGTASDATGTMYTDYIPVRRNETIITKYYSTIGVSVMVLYSSSKTRVGSVNGVRDGDYVTYTVPDNSDIYAYGIINNAVANLDTLMIVEGTTYPASYMPYGAAVLNDNVPLSLTQEAQVDSKIKILSEEYSNLFDKQSAYIQNGYYSGGFQSNASYRATHPIAIKANVVYKYPHSPSMGGNYQIAILDSNGDYIAYKVGTYSNGFVTFSLGYDANIRANIGKTVEMQSFVFAEESKFPANYQPYGYKNGKTIYPNDNYRFPEMLGKKIVFDGDSICRGASDTTPGESYPARIGNDAGMEWYNLGVSGGTIAVVSGISHNLCTYIDTIISQHPDLDYLVLEGGTNDADHLLDAGLGALSAVDDFSGSYNTSTFYGAIETLFYKAVNAYPGKKIGYIVAMKMGTSATLLNRRRGYFDAAINACKKWGIPYLDLWNGCKINPCLTVYYDPTKTPEQNIADGKYYADGQHPTAVGYDYLYQIIEKWIATL